MKEYLKAYTVSDTVFSNIILTMKNKLVYTDHLNSYYGGYPEKNKIRWNGYDKMIIREAILAEFVEGLEPRNIWYQVIISRVDNQDQDYMDDITGTYCYHYINKILRNFYSESEIENCLNSHTAKYDERKKQFHFFYGYNHDIVRHDNCYKYDINGAHCDAICEIFPRARVKFEEMYKQRKIKPIIKKYFNYYVGALCNHGHRLTYNWIVQRTSKQLFDAILKVGGDLIYANTDGFIIKDATEKLITSKELGDFKLEFEGTCYTYQDKNYWVVQYEKDGKKETTGSLFRSVRDKLDLSAGRLVHYEKERIIIGKDQNNNDIGVYKPVNIREEQI